MILYVVEFPEGFPEGDLSSPKKGPNPGFGAVTRGLSPIHISYSYPGIYDLLEPDFSLQIITTFLNLRLYLFNTGRCTHNFKSTKYGGIVKILDVILKECLVSYI